MCNQKLYDDVKDVLDQFKFTYKGKLGTEDAVNALVQLILKQPKAYMHECSLLILAQHLTPFSPMSYWRKWKQWKSTPSSLNGTTIFRLADHNLLESSKPIPTLWPQTQVLPRDVLVLHYFIHST